MEVMVGTQVTHKQKAKTVSKSLVEKTAELYDLRNPEVWKENEFKKTF